MSISYSCLIDGKNGAFNSHVDNLEISISSKKLCDRMYLVDPC